MGTSFHLPRVRWHRSVCEYGRRGGRATVKKQSRVVSLMTLHPLQPRAVPSLRQKSRHLKPPLRKGWFEAWSSQSCAGKAWDGSLGRGGFFGWLGARGWLEAWSSQSCAGKAWDGSFDARGRAVIKLCIIYKSPVVLSVTITIDRARKRC